MASFKPGQASPRSRTGPRLHLVLLLALSVTLLLVLRPVIMQQLQASLRPPVQAHAMTACCPSLASRGRVLARAAAQPAT